MRFHSLPRSKRYATTGAERVELLARHHTVLTALCGMTATSTADLRVVTSTWSSSPAPADRDVGLTDALLAVSHWQSLPYDLSDPSEPMWVHLHVGIAGLDSTDLRALIVLVADDAAPGVLVCPPTAAWVFHPYDGGADVIAPDATVRDLMRERWADWVSEHPQGL